MRSTALRRHRLSMRRTARDLLAAARLARRGDSRPQGVAVRSARRRLYAGTHWRDRLANLPDPALLLSHTPAWRIQPAIHPRGSFVSATETI